MKVEDIQVGLTSKEIYAIFRSIAHERSSLKSELNMLNGCVLDIDKVEECNEVVNKIKGKIELIDVLEAKLMKARVEWLVKPMRDAEVNE